jgi:hypothetical protein
MIRGKTGRARAVLIGIAAAACLALIGVEGRSIGLAEKPQPEEQEEQEVEPSQGGSAAAAAAAGEQAQKRPEPESPSQQDTLTPIEEEERLHLRRMARINRIQALGIEHERQKLVDLARRVRDAEQERHDLKLKRLTRELEAAPGGER